MTRLRWLWTYLTAPLAKLAGLRVFFAVPEAFWKPVPQKPFPRRPKR